MPNTIKLKQLDRAELTAFVNELIDGTGLVYTANRALVTDSLGDIVVSSVTSTELGYLSGVTSAIQTQLNAKQATITGGATSITSSDLTASRALTSDVSGKVAVSSVTATELGYVSGVTSAIQTQLNTKVGTSLTSAYIFVGNVSNIATGVVVSGDISISNAGVVAISNGVIVDNDINASAAIAVTKLAAVTTGRALVSDVSGFISASSVTSTELGYVSGVTSGIQSQISSKFTLPSLTSGSVLFSDGTTISQSNSNLFWNSSSNRLGIGINSSLPSPLSLAATNPAGTFTRLLTGTTTTAGCYNALETITSNPANVYRGFYHGITITGSGTWNTVIANAFEVNITSSDSATHSVRKGALDMTAIYRGTGSIATLSGCIVQASQFGTGTVSDIYAIRGSITTSSSSGTVTDAHSANFLLSNSSGTTITNYYGLRILSITNSGTITNTYGCYIGDITTGTQTNTPYSFYASDSDALNYFAGKVGINKTIPTAQLDLITASSTTVGILIKAASSQSGDLLQFRNSSDTILSKVKSDGTFCFGTHSAIGAETITGYITIEDSGGTSRKLAIVS